MGKLPLRARLATTVAGAAGRMSRLSGRGDGSVIGGAALVVVADGFFRLVELYVFAPSGALRRQLSEFVASGDGRGFGVALDACGSAYAMYDAMDAPFPGSPIYAYIVKVSP